MICPKCGKDNPPEANFCNECATPFKEINIIPPKDHKSDPLINPKQEKSELKEKHQKKDDPRKHHVRFTSQLHLHAPEDDSSQHVTPAPAVIVILIIAILTILAGLVIATNIIFEPSSRPSISNPETVATTMHTLQSIRTPVITEAITLGFEQAIVPSTGVWVVVSYPGTYIGLIGTPGNQMEVSDTGNHLYPISIREGNVSAVFQKTDESGDQIILEVYRNGVMLKRESSNTIKGIVEIQLDLKKLK